MLHLPPLPSHVLVPGDIEIEQARRVDTQVPSIRWRPQDCIVCQGARKYLMWTDHVGGPIGEWECDCQAQMILERWFAVRGIQRWYQQLRVRDCWGEQLGDGVPASALTVAFQWMDDIIDAVRYGDGLLLVGSNGSGKTLLASLIVRAALRAGLTNSRFLNAQSIGNLDQWSNTDFREYWNGKIRSAQVLVIDDIGRESHKSRERQDLRDLIVTRAANCQSTILTSNRPLSDLGEAYGSTAWRSITDVCQIVQVDRADGQPFNVSQYRQSERKTGIMRPVVFS